MRLAIKNQYTSKQKEQKNLPGARGRPRRRSMRPAVPDGLLAQHLRASMHPEKKRSHVGTKISDVLGKPNGYVYRGADASMCHMQGVASAGPNAIVMKTHKPNTMAQATCTYDASNNRCVGPNPETTVVKTASTVVRPEYSVSAREYQYRRGILPEQHAAFTPVRSQQYLDVNGKLLAPTDSPTEGSQVFQMTQCSDHATSCNRGLTTFKPSNRAFKTSNAVTSSARTVKLQHDVLTRENHAQYKTNGAYNTNYIPGAFARQTIKTFSELDCNVGNRALTRMMARPSLAVRQASSVPVLRLLNMEHVGTFDHSAFFSPCAVAHCLREVP